MLVCYYKMCSILWQDGMVGNYSDALARAQMEKRKLVKMFLIVVLMFAVCWLPYHVYFLYIFHDPSVVRKSYIQHVYLFLFLLAMTNSCINPFVYYIMNKR